MASNFSRIELSWGGSRTIEHTQIGMMRDVPLFAYRSEVKLDGESIGVTEGIATMSSIKRVQKMASILSATITLGRSGDKRQEPILLCKPEMKELWRTSLSGDTRGDFYDRFEKAIIREPYSFYAKGGHRQACELLVPSPSYDGNLYSVEGVAQPCAMSFGYMNGHVDNGHYDLKASLEILQKRTNIVWVDDRLHPDEPKIHAIPHYNAERDRNQQLCFIWQPSVEEWFALGVDKIVTHSDSLSRWERVIEAVFKLPTRKEEAKQKCRACKAGDTEPSDEHYVRCGLYRDDTPDEDY